MTNVIHFQPEDWFVLRQIRDSIPWMEERNNNGKFDLAIEKEYSIYQSTLSCIVGNKDD